MAKKKARSRAKKKKKHAPKKKPKWACPDCGIDHTGKHKKTLKKECDRGGGNECGGFICECEDATEKGHGDSLKDPCEYAVCYHCGWAGQFPQGKEPNWKRKYACLLPRARDYHEHLESILKFLKESWAEDDNQEDVEPLDRTGDFDPSLCRQIERVHGHWCPSMISELEEILEEGTVYAPAKV
jgi:hypothetical protein